MLFRRIKQASSSNCTSRYLEKRCLTLPSPKSQRVGTSELFVGRDLELARLTDLLSFVQTDHGRLAMLVGEPGIGKTRTWKSLYDLPEMGLKCFGADVTKARGLRRTGRGYKSCARFCTITIRSMCGKERVREPLRSPKWYRVCPIISGTFRNSAR